MFGMEIFSWAKSGTKLCGGWSCGEKAIGVGDKGWERNAMDKKVLIISFKSLIISFGRK